MVIMIGSGAYSVNGATQAQGEVVVPVKARINAVDRLDLTGADSPIFAEPTLSPVPLLVAPLLLAPAEAFRRDTELAREVD